MIHVKRAVVLALACAVLSGLLCGCGQESEQAELSVCVGPKVETFDPAYVTEPSDATVVGNLYENLMRLTTTTAGETVLTEGIARSVDVEDSYGGTQIYTFRLRGARWSDGRSLRARDFVYAWRRLADPAVNSPNACLLSMVQGYDEVQAGGDPSLLAVSAKNDSTLVVTLSGRYEWFLSEVCTAVATSPLRQDVVQNLSEQAGAAGKWWDDPTRLVTNGPYCVSEYGQELELSANEHYYGAAGPGKLHFLFAHDAENAWQLYEEEAVDFVSPLPDQRITQRIDASQGQWAPSPELSAYTVLFNTNQLPFDDEAVRRAFSLAVNRSALAELAGVTGQPAPALVPAGIAGLEGEDFRAGGGDLLDVSPEGYEDRCAEARDLLRQSSFDERYGYHLEYLYVNEGPAARIAEALVQQWSDVLHVTVQPMAISEGEMQAALSSGEYWMAARRYTPVVDDAEAFLTPFRSEDSRNACGFSSSAYDTLLAIVEDASDTSARLGCLHDAEVLLMDSAAVCPLYTASTAWELRDSWSGLIRDSRGWFLFDHMSTAS